MKLFIFFALVAAFAIIECRHTFMGTNVQRPLVYKRDAKYSSYTFQKRIETITFTMPPSLGFGKTIQGILAYDFTKTTASANVTNGGIGYSFVTLRMKSERGRELHYGIYIYA